MTIAGEGLEDDEADGRSGRAGTQALVVDGKVRGTEKAPPNINHVSDAEEMGATRAHYESDGYTIDND